MWLHYYHFGLKHRGRRSVWGGRNTSAEALTTYFKMKYQKENSTSVFTRIRSSIWGNASRLFPQTPVPMSTVQNSTNSTLIQNLERAEKKTQMKKISDIDSVFLWDVPEMLPDSLLSLWGMGRVSLEHRKPFPSLQREALRSKLSLGANQRA